MPRPSCPRCCRPQAHCLCPLIPRLPSRTRVLILQHPSEAGHALNTARLAALGLCNAELQVGEVFEDLPRLLGQPGYRAHLLFPGDGAQMLRLSGGQPDDGPSQYGSSQYGPSVEPAMLLVVPDGTWRKARKLLYCNPVLAALPRVSLEPGLPSRYRLRKAPGPGALSTLEAVVAALNVLEAPSSFDALLAPFEALIDAQIAAMGEDTFRRNHPHG